MNSAWIGSSKIWKDVSCSPINHACFILTTSGELYTFNLEGPLSNHQALRLELNGSEALAWGALEAGVQFVTGYPGSPGTGIVDALLRINHPNIRIEWGSSERSAFDAAFGFALAGVRSLVCFKSVGLNVALDSLMTCNYSGSEAGFVILTGDDPGGWGSQNEEDSRPLIAAAEVPLLEPTSVAEGRSVMCQAFELSERYKVPVVVRITYPFSKDQELVEIPAVPALRQASFQREHNRWVVLPYNVINLHARLQETLASVQEEFEAWPVNQAEGQGQLGIIAPGQAYQKLVRILHANGHPARILRLGTLHPLPEKRITAFLREVDAVLVVEEIAPFLEFQVQVIAQRAGLTLPVYGRKSGHLPGAGELFAQHVAAALVRFLPGWVSPSFERRIPKMISQEPLCEGCPYIPGFSALAAVMERHGGRDAFIITGEAGCMVRAQVTPMPILDVKYALGSSIGLGAGLARAGLYQQMISLVGDSAFIHTGIGELIDAVHSGVKLLVVILDNATSAISGGQPHPGTAYDLQGRARRPVDIVALARAAGVEHIRVVDPNDRLATEQAYTDSLATGGVTVVILRDPCPYFLIKPA